MEIRKEGNVLLQPFLKFISFFFLTNLDEMRSQWQGRMHVVKNDEENEEKVQRDYPGNGKEMS